MRVAYIHPFSQQLSGPDESLLALLGPLARLGVEAHLVVPRIGPLASRYEALGATVHARPLTILHRHMSAAEILLFAPRLLVRALGLARLLRRLRADLVHTNMEVVLEGALAARLCGIPHVLHYRGNSLDSPRLLFDLLTLVWTASAEKVYCISHATADIFRRRHRDAKVEVLYNAISVAEFRRATRTDEVRASLGAVAPDHLLVINVGRIHPRKDMETFLRAAALVAAAIPEARFAIIGTTETASERTYLERLVALAESLGLTGRLTFAGARTDIPFIMKAAELLVLTSRHEGFGRVIAEAMGAGTPVIGSREGALPELIEEPRHGDCAVPGDPVDFGQRIVSILRDDSRRQEVGAAARHRSLDFDAGKLAARVFRCYEDLLVAPRRERGRVMRLSL